MSRRSIVTARSIITALALVVAGGFADGASSAPHAPAAIRLAAPAAHVPPRILAPSAHAAPLNTSVVTVTAVVTGAAPVRVDGRRVGVARSRCARGVAQVRVDVSQLPDGMHVLAVGGRRVAFTLDRSVPRAKRNRVERAATPSPFACLTRTGFTLLPGRSLAPGERIVLSDAKGTRLVSARALGLKAIGGGRYVFRRLASPFRLRAGNDWGALGRRDRVYVPASAEDGTRAAEATLGAAGGSVTVVDERGVRATLEVPAGALSQPTRIRIVPLRTAALPGARLRQPGLRFEPKGLVFARPASLRLEFAGTGMGVTAADRISLVTSPLTALPLPGSADVAANSLTALLDHFSTTVGGLTEEQLADLRAWADPILSSAQRLTLSEVQSLFELAELQEQTGCSGACVDLEQVKLRTDAAVETLFRDACTLDVGDASDAALERWLALASAAEGFGGDAAQALDCAQGVLRALIVDSDGPEGDLEDADVQRLLTLEDRAQSLGFAELEGLALQKVQGILRARLADQRALCAIDAAHARTRMSETLALAQQIGATDVEAETDQAIAACVAAPSAPPSALPPAPVGAPGCETDIADPTDAALLFWASVEQAAPAGADVTAVRACASSILGALISESAAAATADRADAKLQRLLDLGSTATSLSFPQRATEALQALASVLRSALADASALCATDSAAARTELQRILVWAGHVSSVDATLATSIETALASDACVQRKTLTVTVVKAVPWTTFAEWTSVETQTQYDAPSLATLNDRTVLPAATPPPVTLSAVTSDGFASGSLTVSQPASDTVAYDLEVEGCICAALYSNVSVDVALDVTATEAGTLTIDPNPAWLDPAQPGSADNNAVALRVDGVLAWVGPAAQFTDIPIAAGETKNLVIRSLYHSGTVQGGPTPFRGSGRFLTIRLT